VESFNYNDEDRLVAKWVYKTDSNGRIKEMFDAVKSDKIEFFYGSDNQVLLAKHNEEVGKFEYNLDGTLKGMVEGVYSHKYIYDRNKVLIKKEFYYENKMEYIEKYIYDEEGYLKESLFYILEGKKEDFFARTVYVYR
jgi:hypothetical protein